MLNIAEYKHLNVIKRYKRKEHGGVAGNRTNARLQGQVRAFEGFKANRYILMKVPAARDKVISKKSIPLKTYIY